MSAAALSLFISVLTFHSADSAPRLKLQSTPPAGATLEWEALVPPVVGAEAEYQILISSNLQSWAPSGTIKATDSGSVQLPLGISERHQFFQLERRVTLSASPTDSGSEISGFNPAYKSAYEGFGELTLEEFMALYPPPSNHLEQIDFDPTTAEFWAEWNTDPAVHNANLPAGAERRSWDFRLNETELATFKKLGFVVSERLATASFGEMMYRIYTDDLPVFLSADSMLQAWHRSYASMLQELEETYFYIEWIALLEKMAGAIPPLWQQHNSSFLREPLLDADYFLTVALSLARGTNVPSQLFQDSRVSQTLSAIGNEQLLEFELFGTCRRLDFSQFKVRGHYEESVQLGRYFQLVMWLGRIEFRITDAKSDISCNANNPERELASSALLYFLLQESGGFDSWTQMNAAINVFVGQADSMNFAHLGELLAAAGIDAVSDLIPANSFYRLQQLLMAGDFGLQEIMSDTYVAPNGKLPRVFTVFGQRFVPDSWALGKVVWDNFKAPFDSPKRYLPISLDVAFGTLGNNAAVPELVAQMQNTSGFELRDGFQYQRNLAAVRHTIDSQSPAYWSQNIYTHWLATLRSLSASATNTTFPQAFRTHAWSMKNLNSQLASWTHLRHDTVLYAKQSYSGHIICSYPKAYVEPVPQFWSALEDMAAAAADSIERLDLPHRILRYRRTQDYSTTDRVESDTLTIQSNQVTFLRSFADRMEMLQDIATRQLAREALTPEQITALRDIVEIQNEYVGRRFTGWYPNLFYRNCFFQSHDAIIDFHSKHGCDRADNIITDVHTAPSPEPGWVLHQAVGRVNFLLIAIDCGDEPPVIYGGPVLSHYELPTQSLKRHSDSEWSTMLASPQTPPAWTSEYLIRN